MFNLAGYACPRFANELWVTYKFIACCRIQALMFNWFSAMPLYSVSPVVSYSVKIRTQYCPQVTVALSLGCMDGWKWLED